jgi:hypothetical protein
LCVVLELTDIYSDVRLDVWRDVQPHDSTRFTRSVPKRSRFGSPNPSLNPVLNTGTQFSVINCQTTSEPMWWNERKFTFH